MILPVAVAMAWYEHKLFLGAAAQVRKFHYPRMHSSKMTVQTGLLAIAMHCIGWCQLASQTIPSPDQQAEGESPRKKVGGTLSIIRSLEANCHTL